MAGSTDTTTGWMPIASRVSIPDTNFSQVTSNRRAVCLHIIEGSVASALSVFKAKNSQKSSHFVVSKAGLIWQCVSVDDSAYANGLSWNEAAHCWVDPQGHYLRPPNPSPAWRELTPPVNPNLTTISIEREGYYQDVPTDAQNAAVVKIMQWCEEQFPMLGPYTFLHTLIGHCHISPVTKSNCPGPHINYAALAAAANATQPRTVRAGPFGAIAQQDRRPDALSARYYAPDKIIEVDDLTNNYYHTVDQAGFIPAGQVLV